MNNNYCHVANKIAEHNDEPETKECECGSSMTQHDGDVFLTCDSGCDVMTAEQYEADAKADHFSEEQFPNA